jgi:hypothetical protein
VALVAPRDALSGRPKANAEAVQAEIEQGLPQPCGGRKEYTDDQGQVTKVVEWFGYKLHLLVDVKHEVAVAYHITDSKAGDNERVAALVEQAEANLPPQRMETLAYDKAADDEDVHGVLHGHGIKPVIQNRALWKTEPERVLPGGRYPLNLIYDESGTIHCYDTVSEPPMRHRMAYCPQVLRRAGGSACLPRGLVKTWQHRSNGSIVPFCPGRFLAP